MANDYFRFKQFTIKQGSAAFKVTTDSVLLGAWVDLTGAIEVLDIGTGTGLLALMVAQRSNAHITAIEPDMESFQQAVLNVSATSWTGRLSLYNCSLQDFVSTAKESFDVIVTNPPYFTDSLLNPDPRKAMARHNAMLPFPTLLEASNALLTDNGRLNIVIPAVEEIRLIEEATKEGMFCNSILHIKPTPLQNSKRVLMTFSRQRRKTKESTLVIEAGKRHCYSEEYLELTKDFYLDK